MPREKVGKPVGYLGQSGQKGQYRRRSTPPSKENLESLYWRKGLSLPEIAEKYGMAVSTLGYWMDKFEIPRRRGGPRDSFYAIKPRLKPSDSLSYVLGVLAGDGSFFGGNGIQLKVRRKEFADSFFAGP